MLREFVAPVVLIVSVAVLVVAMLHGCAALYSRYETLAGQLESERWLVKRCKDPEFFSNMHQHTDLCISVENNARVGALMLAVRDVTQDFLQTQVASRLGWPEISFPLAALACCAVFLGPSWWRPNREA
jgi:hypothetical protein